MNMMLYQTTTGLRVNHPKHALIFRKLPRLYYSPSPIEVTEKTALMRLKREFDVPFPLSFPGETRREI